ncbi:MAG: radical SAM protein, partial [Dehalococcoidia bacterium]|nr:radical SAM protein [Dehalococcoidia bacterium]
LMLMRRLAMGLPVAPIVRAELKQASLHRWPWPDRRMIDIMSYDYRLKGEKTATVVTQRGCPYACTFCSHTDFYRKIEYRDPAHVAAELRELRDRWGYRAVMLYDDETNISGQHFEALCHELKRGEWVWRGFIKSNLFTAEQAKAAARSGAVQLCTGGESMNAEIKRHIQKKSSVDDDTRFVRLCLENDIAPKIFSMLGLAGETEETAQELEDWLIARARDGLRDADVTVYTPYPGTPMWEAFEKTGSYVALGGKHGLRLVHKTDFAGETTHYKGRQGEYISRVETFDPATGKTLMTAEQIVAARDRVDARFRAEVARLSGQADAKMDG